MPVFKTFALVAATAVAASLSAAAPARDSVLHLPLADVLSMPEAKTQLDGSVSFFLAGAPTPAVQSRLGSDVSNKKTNGVGKDDALACRWAALSALVSFQKSAKERGANAIVDLVSYYRKTEYKDAALYECHAGGVVVGVALKGEYAKIGQ
jgi:uncharacterized protein YbjQ (UPF0145 family)